MEAARKHKRYPLDAAEVTGRLMLASYVEIINISMDGIGLKLNRILNIGSEYNLKLQDRRGFLSLRGVVMRSSLSEAKEAQNGEVMPIYTTGLRFTNVSPDKSGELLAFIERYRKDACVARSNRLNARFHIIASENEMLHCPESFILEQIIPGSMLITCVQALEIKGRLQLELSLYEDETVIFEGIVSSCSAKDSGGQAYYDIGLEFLNLTDRDRQMLNVFMEYRAEVKARSEAEAAADKTPEKTKSDITEEFKNKVEYLYNWHKTIGYYKLFGIPESATNKNIKLAYHAMARKFHQDMHPNVPDDLRDKMNVIFTYVNNAYATLSDPQKRKEYDSTLLRKDKIMEVK